MPNSVAVCNVTNRNVHRRPLTDLQQAILDYVWTHGPATSERIREELLPAHRLKDSTIRTLLRRLEARGCLTHATEGKVFVYRATTHPRRPDAAGIPGDAGAPDRVIDHRPRLSQQYGHD